MTRYPHYCFWTNYFQKSPNEKKRGRTEKWTSWSRVSSKNRTGSQDWSLLRREQAAKPMKLVTHFAGLTLSTKLNTQVCHLNLPSCINPGCSVYARSSLVETNSKSFNIIRTKYKIRMLIIQCWKQKKETRHRHKTDYVVVFLFHGLS